MKKLTLPLKEKDILNLKAGDTVEISGEIFIARDAAHKKLFDLINEGKNLPVNIEGATVYYAGPCPTKPDGIIGSVGPTSSYRMDKYTPTLLDKGLKCIIGKGARNKDVVDSIKKNKAVYFTAIGGAGALYSSKVLSCSLVAYPELLSEAIYKITVKDFPAIVAVDSLGKTIY